MAAYRTRSYAARIMRIDLGTDSRKFHLAGLPIGRFIPRILTFLNSWPGQECPGSSATSSWDAERLPQESAKILHAPG